MPTVAGWPGSRRHSAKPAVHVVLIDTRNDHVIERERAAAELTSMTRSCSASIRSSARRR
jgi:hypothetical protein